MTETTQPHFIVPIRVLDGQTVQPGFADLLKHARVTLVGIVEVPEQTPPGQARMQFEEQALDKLDETADVFRDRSIDIETQLVFTQNRKETLVRLVHEHDADGYILPNPVDEVERVLVPVRDDTEPAIIDRLIRTMTAVFSGDEEITLLRIGSREGEALVYEQLVEHGISPDRIHADAVSSLDISGRIGDESVEYDAVVLVREQPTAVSLVFGNEDERVARRALGPVFVISDETAAEREE